MPPLYPDAKIYPPASTFTPPGMNRDEARVWLSFLQANRHQLTGLMYNVHVGSVPGDSPAESDDQRRERAALYAKRIDVVALHPAQTWLIEVKTQVRPSAIGQLVTYIPLLHARFPDLPPIRPILVAALYDPDAAGACGALKITCAAPPFAALV